MRLTLGRVPSHSTPGRTYAITMTGELTCGCPDAKWRERECSHLLEFLSSWPGYREAQIEHLRGLVAHTQARIERLEQTVLATPGAPA